MKRIILLAVILSAVFIQSNAQYATTKKNYVIGESESVSSLTIDGDINVTLVIAPNEPNVYLEGTDNFTRNVKTSIVNGAMTISSGTSSKSEDDVVLIYAPNLSFLELNGDIQLKTIGTLNAEKIKLSINGNCRLTVQHAGKLKIRVDDNYELRQRTIMRLKAS